MNDNRPMLLRGDNFKVPEKPEPQRYVAEHLKVKGGSKPQVRFVREYVQAYGQIRWFFRFQVII